MFLTQIYFWYILYIIYREIQVFIWIWTVGCGWTFCIDTPETIGKIGSLSLLNISEMSSAHPSVFVKIKKKTMKHSPWEFYFSDKATLHLFGKINQQSSKQLHKLINQQRNLLKVKFTMQKSSDYLFLNELLYWKKYT